MVVKPRGYYEIENKDKVVSFGQAMEMIRLYLKIKEVGK